MSRILSTGGGACLGPGPWGASRPRLGVSARKGGVSRPRPQGCVSRPRPRRGGVSVQEGCPGSGLGVGGCPGPGGVQARGVCIPACTETDTPRPQQTATAAGGTHPTGMHSGVQY